MRFLFGVLLAVLQLQSVQAEGPAGSLGSSSSRPCLADQVENPVEAKLSVAVDSKKGHFSLSVLKDQEATFSSLPVRTTKDGKTLKAGKDLELVNVTTSSGADKIGHFEETRFIWSETGGNEQEWTFETAILQYDDEETLVFVQHWPQGANGTSVGRANHAASHWPGLSIAPEYYEKIRKERPLEFVDYLTQLNIGYLSFNDRFMQRSAASVLGYATHELGGERAGPLIFFDLNMTWNLAVAPLTRSMSSNMEALNIRDGEIFAMGLLGSIDHVPAGYELRTVFTFTKQSVTLACKQLGDTILRYHDIHEERQAARERDISLSYLGYITDNGAYYYYKTENDVDYEQTMFKVYADAQNAKIPYRYIQLDSWWYRRGEGGGVAEWEARDDVFPHGLAAFSEKTNWPLFLHNRYWSPDNVYRAENGGKYQFRVQDAFSVPTEQAFWNDLMKNMTKQGMFVYEQDWLYNEFEGMSEHLMKDPNLGYDWLEQMGRAALAWNVSIQYCMPLPRMVMHSTQLPAVTQVRAGDDYHPGNTKECRFPYCLYYIQTTSLLLWSLDLAPAKDVFWTSQVQPGNPYVEDAEEPNAEMIAAVAIYSTGPVQTGDKVGYTDKKIIDLMCTPDGRLLQPSRPLTSIDQCFIEAAFGGAAPNMYMGSTLSTKGHEICAISSTHTAVQGLKWVHVMAILSQRDIKLSPQMLPVDVDPDRDYLAYTGYGSPKNFTTMGTFDSNHPLMVRQGGASDFTLVHAAPWLGDGKASQIAVLGEAAKFVPVSAYRFASMAVQNSGVRMGLRGTPGEQIVISVAHRASINDPNPHLQHLAVTFTQEEQTLWVPFSLAHAEEDVLI